MQTRVSLALFLVFLAACATTSSPPAAATATPEVGGAEPSGDDRYPIVVHRPFSVGQRVHVAVEVRQRVESVRGTEQATATAKVSEDRKADVELLGVIEVMDVDATGRISLAKLTVERFLDKAGSGEIVRAGGQITAERDASGVVMLVDGKPPAANVAPMLRLAFPLTRPGGMLGDDIIGTDVPKAIGESWEVARSSTVTDLEGEGYSAAQGEIAGTVKLASKQPCDKAECLEVVAKLQVKQVSIGAEYDVRDATKGTLDVELKLMLPTDAALPVYEERALLRSEFESAAQAGEGSPTSTSAKTVTKVERDRHATYTLVTQ